MFPSPYHNNYPALLQPSKVSYRDLLYNPDKKLYLAVKEPDNYYGKVKETLWLSLIHILYLFLFTFLGVVYISYIHYKIYCIYLYK